MMPTRLQKYMKPALPPIHLKGTNKKISVVLFLSHKEQQCGVYQYGKRVYHILKKCMDIRYEYREVSNVGEYHHVLNTVPHDVVLYNFHNATMPWLTAQTIQRRCPNIAIPHECNRDIFDKIISINPNTPETGKVFAIPRPIFEVLPPKTDRCDSPAFHEFVSYRGGEEIPVFGSFGFGFRFKGFPEIVKMINEQYDYAIIKFVIPHAHFDNQTDTVQRACQDCFQQNKKEGIRLMIYTDFVSEHDLLLFLASNTMNLFLYDKLHKRGISSTIDYALSVKRPIGISDSFFFQNIYHDDICLYKNSIRTCMEKSKTYGQHYCNLYSHKNMIDKFKYILQH